MAFIRIKERNAPSNELVYQGPAETGCECIFDEKLVHLWACDPTFEHGSLEVFLSPHEAKKVAKQLLHHAATIESGVLNE
jgi:hypothetical protein